MVDSLSFASIFIGKCLFYTLIACRFNASALDASQYKDYVLVLLFVKYVSDKAAADPQAILRAPEGARFEDMVALKNKKNIGEGMDTIIGQLAKENDLQNVIDIAAFNDPDKMGKGEKMVERLTKLVGIFENPALNFAKNRAEDDDLLGDAYEFLMRHFATESGKSKGQFYTPAEVSRVLAKVVGIKNARSQDQTLYDPTCGSGSLLLRAAAESPRGITIYGQESDNATFALSKMNMILHGIDDSEIWKDDTLAAPHFKNPQTGGLKTFDFVVANPPFSSKSWSSGVDVAGDPFRRFELGRPICKANGLTSIA